jgi:hypothetical protein
MEKTGWKSRAKDDLIIEVWEYLDCESVGAKEILAIEQAVRERFGDGAIENPMIIARQLADEGAELRHPEIMNLFVKYEESDPYAAMFRGVLKTGTLRQTLSSIRSLENLRKKFQSDIDKKGLSRLRDIALRGKQDAVKAASALQDEQMRKEKEEISRWLGLWLETPELFENWVAIRMRSSEFVAAFGGSI